MQQPLGPRFPFGLPVPNNNVINNLKKSGGNTQKQNKGGKHQESKSQGKKCRRSGDPRHTLVSDTVETATSSNFYL